MSMRNTAVVLALVLVGVTFGQQPPPPSSKPSSPPPLTAEQKAKVSQLAVDALLADTQLKRAQDEAKRTLEAWNLEVARLIKEAGNAAKGCGISLRAEWVCGGQGEGAAVNRPKEAAK